MAFKALTPNLIVRNVEASVAFYRDVLGFALEMSVPEAPPYLFAGVTRDAVRIFLNDARGVAPDIPSAAAEPRGRLLIAFIEVTDLDGLYGAVAPRAPIVMQPAVKSYGFREFAVVDPDGYVLMFAERVG